MNFLIFFSSGGKGPQVALLHPRLLAVYAITRSNSKEKTTLESYQMNLVYQHKLTRSAYSMCIGKLAIEIREIKFYSEIFNLICGFLFHSFHSIIHTTNQLLSSFCYLLFQDLLEEFKAKIICVSNHLMGLWIFLRMRASVSADFYQVFLYPDHWHMWQKQIVLSLFHHPFS